jgi:hypothetical protein
VLDSQPLGLYAVKKVAVGESHDYLLKVLREVQLLQTLRHENIGQSHLSQCPMSRTSMRGSEHLTRLDHSHSTPSHLPSRVDRADEVLKLWTQDPSAAVSRSPQHLNLAFLG